jgi:hypothetical protein
VRDAIPEDVGVDHLDFAPSARSFVCQADHRSAQFVGHEPEVRAAVAIEADE